MKYRIVKRNLDGTGLAAHARVRHAAGADGATLPWRRWRRLLGQCDKCAVPCV